MTRFARYGLHSPYLAEQLVNEVHLERALPIRLSIGDRRPRRCLECLGVGRFFRSEPVRQPPPAMASELLPPTQCVRCEWSRRSGQTPRPHRPGQIRNSRDHAPGDSANGRYRAKEGGQSRQSTHPASGSYPFPECYRAAGENRRWATRVLHAGSGPEWWLRRQPTRHTCPMDVRQCTVRWLRKWRGSGLDLRWRRNRFPAIVYCIGENRYRSVCLRFWPEGRLLPWARRGTDNERR